jgi:hypothetical protein
MHAISTQIDNEARTVLDSAFKNVQIYTDQTGRFPVVSTKGNKHIMSLYEYDDNAIMSEPLTIEQH